MKKELLKKHLRARFLSKYKVVKWALAGQKPATLEVHPAYPCNMKCEFCIDVWLKNVPSIEGLDINRDSKSMLSKENVDTIIQGCIDLKIPGIVISGGGEPTINPNTVYLVEQAHKHGIKTGMFTNGLALNDQNIPSYVTGLSFLRFSFDSFDPENYAKTKGVNEKTYFKVMENMKKCTDYKEKHNIVDCKIGIDFVIQPHSVHLIPGLYKKSSELHMDYVQFCDCVEQGYQFTEKVQEQILEQIEKTMDWRDHQTHILQKDIPEIAYEPIQIRNECTCEDCKMTDYIFQCGADGNVRPCPHTARHDQWCYGNINDTSLKEIWENRKSIKESGVPYLYEFCRFRKQNEILDGLKQIEHGEIL